MALHRHRAPYAALVLAGAFTECGPDGRYHCGVGHLIVHPAWHPHADEFGNEGAVVLNLPLAAADVFSCARLSCAQDIEKLARRAPARAAQAAMEEASACTPLAPAPWLERLARLLASGDPASIGELAARCGVSAAHASRACRRWFGLAPTALRREARLRRALELLERGASPSEAAQCAGFCDQPHLTRLLKRMTGRTPATFSAQASKSFKTAQADCG